VAVDEARASGQAALHFAADLPARVDQLAALDLNAQARQPREILRHFARGLELHRAAQRAVAGVRPGITRG